MTMLFKTVSAALLLGVAAVPAAAQQLSPPVIVVVDLDRVVNESAAGKQAATELQAKGQQIQTRRTTLAGQLQSEAQAIGQGQQNKTLAGPALEQRVKAFQDKENAANQELGRAQEDLARSQRYVIEQITNAANPIITQVMRERGASIALQKGATIQHSASLEVTNDVIGRLNTSLPRVSITPPAAPPAAAPAAPRN
ncbi:MAG: outer membrane chaperone Skp [Sphingomonas sp.]|nr:MAG: outer membrane chaperone Skp [Sphingomonas sp.]